MKSIKLLFDIYDIVLQKLRLLSKRCPREVLFWNMLLNTFTILKLFIEKFSTDLLWKIQWNQSKKVKSKMQLS